MTKKKTLNIILFFIFSLLVNAHERLPDNESAFNQSYDLNVFISKERHSLAIKGQIQNNERLSQNQNLSLSYRLKISKKFKVIAEHGLHYGLRHNEDWVVRNGLWQWLDTTDRRESITSYGIQYKEKLHEKWLFKLKAFHSYNSFNEQQDISLRPGLLYFSGPKSLQMLELRLNLPANYARQIMNYYSVYLGSLYFINPKFAIGPNFGYGIQRWTESLTFKGLFNEGYEVDLTQTFIGLTINTYLDL